MRWRSPLGGGSRARLGRRAQPLRLTMPEEILLARRLELLGLGAIGGLRVTDNRSVMVSLSAAGVLSIHRGYARAPDRVLRAVVGFLAPRTPAEVRRIAEREILAFRAEEHAQGPPRRRRRPDRPKPGDLERCERLARLFRHLNRRHFGDALPELPVRLSGRMRTRLGQLCMRHESGQPYEITISRRHILQHGWAEVSRTLLHEMVHLWQHENGYAVDHGPLFKVKAEETGVVASAHRTVKSLKSRNRAARFD